MGISEQILSQKVPVTAVTSAMLKEIFRQTTASEILQKAAIGNPQVLEKLLEIIQPIHDPDFIELDGCRCLPLADNSLGTIKFTKNSKSADYYLATEEELKLFKFASAILITQEPGRKFKQVLIESKKFSIAPLTFSSVGCLLKKNVLNYKTSEEMDKWMIDFWAYWNRVEGSDRIRVKTLMSDSDIRSHPIFEATCNGIRSYAKPLNLDTLSAVVNPSKKEHQALCDKFSGMYKFNQNFLPEYIKVAEATLDKRQSFIRFVKALVTLAGNEGSSVELYIRKCLAPADMEVCLTTLFYKNYS